VATTYTILPQHELCFRNAKDFDVGISYSLLCNKTIVAVPLKTGPLSWFRRAGFKWNTCISSTSWVQGLLYALGDPSKRRSGSNKGMTFSSSPERLALKHNQPSVQRILKAPSLGIKSPERQADHLPPNQHRVKNSWSYASIPPYVFTAWCLNLAQGQRISL
jgi:hypothetical protein